MAGRDKGVLYPGQHHPLRQKDTEAQQGLAPRKGLGEPATGLKLTLQTPALLGVLGRKHSKPDDTLQARRPPEAGVSRVPHNAVLRMGQCTGGLTHPRQSPILLGSTPFPPISTTDSARSPEAPPPPTLTLVCKVAVATC